MLRQFSYDTVDSTNRLAIERVQSGVARPPFIVQAATQSAGRGRYGRAWASPRGGLWFSVAWAAAAPLGQYETLPLVVGAGLAATLEHALGLACAVKWPNDVLIDQRKVGGVLCQMELTPAPFVTIGIGINANFSTAELPRDLRHPATTLQDELGHAVDLPALLGQLVETLESDLNRLEQNGFAALAGSVQRRIAGRGAPSSVRRRGAAGHEF